MLGAPWLSPLLSSHPCLGDGLNYKSSVRAPSVIRSAEPFANLGISVKHGESFESAIAVPENAKNGIFWTKRIPLNRSRLLFHRKLRSRFPPSVNFPSPCGSLRIISVDNETVKIIRFSGRGFCSWNKLRAKNASSHIGGCIREELQSRQRNNFHFFWEQTTPRTGTGQPMTPDCVARGERTSSSGSLSPSAVNIPKDGLPLKELM